MDEMKLELKTKFMRDIIAKIISRTIRKKTGYKINIQLDDLDASVVDGEMRIHTSVEAKMSSDEFMKMMKTIGLKD